MKILQSIAKEMFIQKNDSANSGQVNQSTGATEIKSEGALLSTEDHTDLTSLNQPSQEDIDSEIVAVLSEEKTLTPEEKKQIRQLLKMPALTKHEKIQAIQLMLRKELPLTSEVLAMVHEGLTTDLFPEGLISQIKAEPSAQELLPLLLKQLIVELSQKEVALPLAKGDDLKDLLQYLTENSSSTPVIGDETDFLPKTQPSQEALSDSRAISSTEVGSTPIRGVEHASAQNDLVELTGSEAGSEWENESSVLQGVYSQLTNLLQSTGHEGKLLLRKEVTEVMRTVKQNFEQFKKVTIEQLKSAEQTPSQPQRKVLLEKTIEAVDRLIMKSDVPLFASMKLEKKLLVLSSDLQAVKKLVEQGKLTEAKSSMRQVIQTLESLSFQPSAKKVIYQSGFINSGFNLGQTELKGSGLDLSGVLGKQIASFSELKGSPRMVLEHLRGLGLNLEGEAHQSSNRQSMGKNMNKQKTIYTILEALSNEGAERTDKKETQPLEKALVQSLGAHRLINKLEEGSPKQTIDLTIPYRMDQGVFELKVHIEARKQNELLDWENFKMFFVLETPKVGQVGIGLHTVDRKLSLTFKGENRRALQVLAPMADALKKDLVGFGYQLVGIQYGLLQHHEAQEEVRQPEPVAEVTREALGTSGRKGVDYKV